MYGVAVAWRSVQYFSSLAKNPPISGPPTLASANTAPVYP